MAPQQVSTGFVISSTVSARDLNAGLLDVNAWTPIIKNYNGRAVVNLARISTPPSNLR